ncbi:hypothetical protein LZ31DRAFT_315208 [Colletotrichum somersetense]|nr:hypothetical protein LZ31DRAFT_315208 [Colletotrichum somersetense]
MTGSHLRSFPPSTFRATLRYPLSHPSACVSLGVLMFEVQPLKARRSLCLPPFPRHDRAAAKQTHPIPCPRGFSWPAHSAIFDGLWGRLGTSNVSKSGTERENEARTSSLARLCSSNAEASVVVIIPPWQALRCWVSRPRPRDVSGTPPDGDRLPLSAGASPQRLLSWSWPPSWLLGCTSRRHRRSGRGTEELPTTASVWPILDPKERLGNA